MKKIILLVLVLVITVNLTAQKRINLDTLNIEELNVYKDKAVKLRNAGKIVTLTGLGTATAGLISSVIWSSVFEGESGEGFITLVPAAIGVAAVIPSLLIGIPMWTTGGNRKSKAELALKKFDIVPENSMALGLGIRLSF